MSDPPRLLGSPDATDLERKLLSSWDERPSAASRDKTLAMLGIATGTAAAGVATAGASIAPKAAAAGWLAIAKWTGVAVVAIGAASIGIGLALHRSDRIEAPAATSTDPRPAFGDLSTAEHVAPPVVTATVTAPPTPTIELPTEATHHAAPQHVTAPPASSTLADQVAALDRARLALDAHDGPRAHKLVDAYEASYPGGAFTQEAELVRIEALLRDENRAEAERAGKRFLAAYPKSPHAARVRTLLGYDP